MSNWLHNLPIFWMTLFVFFFTYLLSFGLYVLTNCLAKGKCAHAFQAISPGLLPPLGFIFGLFVVFTASQVWTDNERANTAVNREASALRDIVIFSASFPDEFKSRLHDLIRRHIQEVSTQEWPMMAQGTATLRFTPPSLAEALTLSLALTPKNEGQMIAQRGITTAIGTALDARRQRIIISQSHVNLVKWFCLIIQAAAALLAIAMIHCGNRVTSAITIGLFATGVAASVLLITTHDRPFSGPVGISPKPLLQVRPDI